MCAKKRGRDCGGFTFSHATSVDQVGPKSRGQTVRGESRRFTQSSLDDGKHIFGPTASDSGKTLNELSSIDYVNPKVEISLVAEKIDASRLVQQVLR
jgi:hypothetical protein